MNPGWGTTRLGSQYSVRDERAGSAAESLPLMSVSQTRGVVPRADLAGDAGRAETLVNYKVCRPGDIVLNRMSAYNGALGVAYQDGLVSPDYLVMRPTSGAVPDFIAAWLKTPRGVFEMTRRLRGIGTADGSQVRTPRVNESDLRLIPITLPPIPEQRAIVDYLDHETAKIDTLIEEQQRLIEMLRDRRIATIARAVTKGLSESVELVESGVDWIGPYPSHWEVKRLKYSIASSQTGVWGGDPKGDEDDVLCVRVADFDRPRLRVGDHIPTVRSVPEKDRTVRLLESGDLLLEKSGGTNLNPVGFVGIFDGAPAPAVSANFIARLRPAPAQYPRYWLYAHAASYSTRLTARSVKQTTGIQNLDQDSYFNERFPYPPLAEQQRIAAYLDDQTTRIDALIAESERFIELSRERRSALITAAVTGQINVRGEVV